MFCLVVFGFLAFLFFLDWLSFKLRGDCDLILRIDALENLFVWKDEKETFVRFDVPLENRSQKEQALVIFADVFLLPQKKEDKISQVWSKITLAENPRQDGYFEACLVKPEKKVFLRVESRFANLFPREKLEFQISYHYYGRTPMRTERKRISIPFSKFSENREAFQQQENVPKPRTPRKPNVVPISTPLILPGDNLAETIKKYTAGIAKPGDWVAIAESVVAIAQGRVYPVENIRPGFWAKRLNRFFQFNSSLASCYSMEMAIREVGLFRIMLGILAGFLGKLVGRSGDFYRVAGRSVAAIDDCTGTLPPFDKSVVLAPAHPNQTAENLKQETGLDIAVVDANDLGKVDILGKSSGIEENTLIEALLDNPQGNADEQTPFVLIKR
jgi:hypothetical protein